jgi:peptidoglycan/LPS O-acetylase OafA/YrhL
MEIPPVSRISKENNFDLLRLFAALQVFIGHGIHHLGIRDEYSLWEFLSFFPGVLMFFTISGFLIFSSFQRNLDLKKYFFNRFIRIYPALWMCFCITVFLLMFFGVIGFSDFLNPQLLKWIIAQITFFQFWTPDLLRPWGVGTPNGSLWTIPVELQFYVALPIIILIFRKMNLMAKFLLLIVFSAVFNFLVTIFFKGQETTFSKLLGVSIFPYLYCFLTGSVICLFWDKIKFLFEGKALFWFSIFGVFCFLSGKSPEYFPQDAFELAGNFLLSGLTISLAFTSPAAGSFLNRNDISYGIYIYHMPVINTFIALGITGSVTHLFLAILFAIVLSSLSWFFIERKALKLKHS